LEIICQRCHETLRDADRYCPACGLPQLIYIAAETPAIPLGSEVAPGTPDVGAFGDGIVWRPALQVALLLALPAALLGSGWIPVLAVAWIMGAAPWAVGLYARRVQARTISMGTGARIGLVTGLFTALLACGTNGMAFWVNRFVLHQSGQFDAFWVSMVQQNFERTQQWGVQAGLSGAQAAEWMQNAQWFRALELSPEGKAGLVLAALLCLVAIVLLVAAIGGAVGARFMAPTRRTSL
jgi:hypothetical protein